jgi:hypothetical protein
VAVIVPSYPVKLTGPLVVGSTPKRLNRLEADGEETRQVIQFKEGENEL